MKTKLLLLPAAAGVMLLSSCVGWTSSASYDGSGGGIDPVTMAGIEASNRANDEAVQRQWQQTQDMINTQNMINTQDMVNQMNAAAAQQAAQAAMQQ